MKTDYRNKSIRNHYTKIIIIDNTNNNRMNNTCRIIMTFSYNRSDVSDIWDATIINSSLIDITVILNNKRYIKDMHCPLLTSLGIYLS